MTQHPTRALLKRSLAVLRRDGIGGWWSKVRRHAIRHYLLYRYFNRRRRLHKSWYAKQHRRTSIVIPSYNDYRVLRQCLRSLLRTTDPLRTEIVIADDASPSKEHQAFLDTLRQRHVRVVRRKENGGFAKAVNTGIQATASDSDVILLNSDTEARDGWLEALLYAASQDGQVGIVGAKLLYPDKTIQSAGTFRNPIERDWFDHYYRFQPELFGPSNVPSYVFATTAACMLIRRQVIESIGLLDERYAMAFEDVDFCLRAVQRGFRVLYYPHAVLMHHESLTRGRIVGRRELAAKQLFWQQWRAWFESRTVLSNSGRMRIIYVAQESANASGDGILVEHLNRLAGLGYDTQLYAMQGESAWCQLRVPLRTFPDRACLLDELSKQDAIKVATCSATAEPVWLASLQRGIPAYYVHDRFSVDCPGDDLAHDVELSGYRREFHYLTASSRERERLRTMGCVARKVGCGVDLDTFRVVAGVRVESDILVSVGRGDQSARFSLTLDGWHVLAESRPRLWAFGGEPELLAGIERTRYFAGASDAEVNQLLNQAAAFITTSGQDTAGASILQAMAAGTPVICTAAESIDWCVTEENCLVVKADAASVAGAIRRLLSDEALRERLRSAGLRTAARYGWDRVIREIADVYDSIGGHYCPTSRRQEET
jgi:GT2 family glycosyltransferase